ncbi:MAG: PD40 domain-containing protein [Lewinellaceae bacterium]|nr:PD40 domain-containing protein [Lewinellaceae bacterium]HRW74626.1 hypothetical protein [Saprospiraceae bacterium]
MSKCKHFFLLIGFLGPLLSIGSFGQGTDLKKADQLYKTRAYAKAVPLYEASLRSRFRVSTAQKLASCYRLTNAWAQAEALLDSLVQQDRVREDMWFLYGEALMSNGKYDQARDWFLKYAAAQPGDTLALIRADACLIVGNIPPYFPNVRYDRLPFNSEEDDHAAIPWGTGLLFTSDRPPGLHLLKEKSQWTGRDYLALFETYPLTDSTWSEPRRYSGRINEININVGYAILSADSSTLYFTRNTVEPNKRGVYPLQIYTCQREGSEGWSRPRPVSFANPETNMMHPALRADGQMMIYASDRSGGPGGLDLWMVEWSGSDWGRPERLDETINTPGHEGFPWFAPDGRLFFASKGHPGYGGYDLFVTQQDSTGKWTPPLNLGRPLNSPLDDITIFLDVSGQSGYFSSTREGEDDDLYYWYQDTLPGKEEEE